MSRTLFETERMQMDSAIRLTADSLTAYGERYDHWAIAWSGGKDSTTVLTLVVWLIEAGMVPRPKSLTALYADTRQELLPLWQVAAEIRDELAERGLPVQSVMAPLDKRMWVYILGRGVPPPNNNTLRYCTRQIKIEPMQEALAALNRLHGQKILVLTGVRVGESAARDARISLACSKNGSECGQGWFQETLPGAVCDTLAPILHWRICHVWEWLSGWAPRAEYGDWSTRLLAEAYGGRDGDQAKEINARTGCVCCPLASQDGALEALIRMPQWAYLAPLKGIRRIYEAMREPKHRLRKAGYTLDGVGEAVLSEGRNAQRMGPLLLESRLGFLEQLLAIQAAVNAEADRQRRPRVDHLNAEEEARIRELIDAGTWPNGWDGSEPHGDDLLLQVGADGSIQRPLFGG